MKMRWTIASCFAAAAIVGIAAPVHAKPACGCKQQMSRPIDELGGSGPTPRASTMPAAKALEQPNARGLAAPPPARRSLEIEFNFFGRKYSVEFTTTSELDAAKAERNAPALRPTPASTPTALG
jgi:hypothetical protein